VVLFFGQRQLLGVRPTFVRTIFYATGLVGLGVRMQLTQMCKEN